MRNGSLHHRVWWHVSDKALWATRLWRPYCWARRRHVPWEGRCVICAAVVAGG